MNLDKNNLDAIANKKIFRFSLFSVSAMTVLGSTTIVPSLPNLEKHFFNVNNIEVLSKLVLTLPALFIMIFAPISGFILDRNKKLRIIFISIIVWSISGSVGFFLDNIYYILLSRVIFGISTAFVMTGVSSLIADYYLGAKREKALSMQGFYTALGGSFCLILGGILSNIDWRFPFLVYLLGFAILGFAYKNLFEPNKSYKKVNNNYSKFNIFTFLPIYFISFFGMSMFYIVPTQIPFFITDILNKDNFLIGFSLAICSICMAFSSLLYQRLRTIFSFYIIYCLAFMVIGFGYLLIYIFNNYLIMLFALIIIGSSTGILLVTNSSWLFSLANDNIRAKAYGFLASSIFIGQFSSPIITQPFVKIFGINNMFLIFSILLFLVSILFFIKNNIRMV